jgi:hypothetical protein
MLRPGNTIMEGSATFVCSLWWPRHWLIRFLSQSLAVTGKNRFGKRSLVRSTLAQARGLDLVFLTRAYNSQG